MSVTVKELKQLVDPSKNFRAGSVRSQVRLEELGFDPIGELVMLYKQLQNEDKIMCAIRDGVYIQLNDKANKIRYSYVAHMTLLGQLEKVASQLLRYGYGRVPETITVEDKTTESLIINMYSEENDPDEI